LQLDAPSPYSRGVVSFGISRPPVAAAIKVLLPILLVVIVAALVFFINPVYPEARIGMGITALLTLVALQFTANGLLPELGYLTMLDVLFILAYVYVLAVMTASVATSWAAEEADVPRTRALDRRMAAISGVVFALAVAAVMLAYLR
ncbi:MAG: hypothetical protein ACR2J8_10765, partial [Thermomicrobiales bacterium]